MPNRTELNTSSSRRAALELFYYFCKKFGSIEPNFKINWIWCIQVMKILNEDIELFTKKGAPWQNQISSTEFGSIRFENLFKFDTVKLSKVKRLPNRTELNTSSSRRAKKHKNNLNFGYSSPNRISSIRFENLLKFDSFTVVPLY